MDPIDHEVKTFFTLLSFPATTFHEHLLAPPDFCTGTNKSPALSTESPRSTTRLS